MEVKIITSQKSRIGDRKIESRYGFVDDIIIGTNRKGEMIWMYSPRGVF